MLESSFVLANEIYKFWQSQPIEYGDMMHVNAVYEKAK